MLLNMSDVSRALAHCQTGTFLHAPTQRWVHVVMHEGVPVELGWISADAPNGLIRQHAAWTYQRWLMQQQLGEIIP